MTSSTLARFILNPNVSSLLGISCRRLARFPSSLRRVVSTETEQSKTSPDVESTKPEEVSIGSDDTTSEIDDLKVKAEALIQQLEDAEDKYRRSLAEMQNVRQRMSKQVQDAKLFGIQGFCKDLLTVADTMALATENVPKEQLENNMVKSMHDGLKLTESQLLQVLGNHGVKVLNPDGDKFDPNLHEAMFEQPIENKEPGTVFVVTKVGYTLHDRLLRPATVGVVKGK